MSQLMKKRFPSLTSIDIESDGNTSFLRAARNGQLDKVLEHLKSNIDINTSNANGLNALHLASKDGHVEIVEELLKRGAVVDAATKKGNTALHIASLAGQEEVVKLLVLHGASVNVQSQNGFTPLYMAAQENHDNVVKYLLANGANQSLSTEDGFTPLAVAMQQGHDKVVTVLLENDTRGKIRLPALHIAAKKDDVKAAKLLLENEHNPDVTSKSGFTPLHIASHYGNQQIANLLVQKGADVNYAAKHNITPLHVAAKWGKSNMVALLLEHGATIEAKTRDGLTPLHCAARSGHEQVVDMLLERGAPISSKTKNGLAPLHMSAQGDHVDAARILLYHRAPVDEVTVDYLTALHVAAHCGHVRVAKLLLDRQADANARALNGFTPLHIACKKNRIKVVELLLKHGASIGATTESGLTPLHVASFMGCMNIVIYLLQHDANPDVPTVRGETPLHLAARANQTDIIRILLRNGAQVDARAREQQTPLHIASRLGNVDIVMLLLQHGAKVDSSTKDMYTALHIAAKEGQDEVAGVLLENGASLDSTTKKGFTPLHLAAKYGHLKVTKLLLQKEAPVDAQGKNGVTPLHVASHYDHQNVALLLLDKGASPHAIAKNGHTPLHIAARKNQMDIANTLLEYGAKPNAESKAGFTPLHLSAQEGHADMSSLLLEHKGDANHEAKNGLAPLHLCAQEDRVPVAEVLVKNGANVNCATNGGYTPLHIASHYGQVNMVRFLLQNGANIESTTSLDYTPLHQAAQQGHATIVNILLEHNADPNAVTTNGQTPLNIAQKLGYITVIETLKVVTTVTKITTTTTTNIEEKYKVQAPELMHETFMSDSEEEGGEDTVLGDHTYRYLTADEMKSLGDDSLPIDVTRDERIDSNRMVSSVDGMPPMIIEDTISPEHITQNYVEYIKKYAPDNVDINRHPINIGFLVSFLVDARGGAMRGCRHSGVRVIVPPRCAPSPTRITCRYVRPQRTPHPPPLMEGEALASRLLELGPVGAKFLGPVIIEVPHFAALRGKEREIVILRSDNGESWKEHSVDASEDILNQVLHDSFDAEDLNQLEDVASGRITRIVTQDFPQYFAVVSRIRQEVHAIGPEGGMVSSTVVPQVQAVFPEGALTKKIKVGLQAQPIDPELTAKLLGHGVAVSPVVTVEPRRRKFHKAITLSMPAPRAHSQGMINQYSGSAPTLRLLCSITGGTTRAQWEDVTGSTPLTFVNDCVSFTTTVSARFWLMDCRNIGDATRMATELYKEAIHVPFMAKFVVFAKRVDPLEARLRVFCMTDDKEDKTLEHQEHFTEVAKSRDVEVLEGKQQYVEFAGNLVPITKSGEQLSFSFRAFRENRLPFSVRVKDQHAEAVSRCLFMKESKVPKGEPPQQPVCILNIVLPEDIVTDTISLTDSDSLKQYRFLSENFDYYRPDPRLADMSNLLGEDWVPLANQLGLTTSEINVIKSEYPDSVAKQAQSMLRMWLSQTGNKAQTNTLENALKRIGREDIIPQCLNVDQGQTITRIKHEEIGKYRLKKDIDSIDKGAMKDDVAPRVVAETHEVKRFGIKDKYSAEEKIVVKSDEEEEEEQFEQPVAERREKIEKRLSAERQIPASSQRKEIVQEITTIKEQNLVEDKLAEVEERVKSTEESAKIKTIISPDSKTVSKIVEIKTTLPSDTKVLENVLSPTTHVSKTTTVVTEIRTIQSEEAHKTPEDAELLEKVTQSFEKKKVIPKLIADEDPKSPKFSQTPPPSPADFLTRDKAASVQEWEASRQSQPLLEPTAPPLVRDAAQKGNTTLIRTEDKSLSPSLIGLSTDRPFVNKKTLYDLTNALIQSESRAEPYNYHTEKNYRHDYTTDDESSAPIKDEKKKKRGIFGTLKNFVGKSLESDSDSEKSSPKKEKKKKEKKKKSVEVPAELPTGVIKKPKLPTPPPDRRYDDIPYFEASPTDTPDHKKEVSKAQKSITITDIDASDSEIPPNITHKAREIVTAVLSDGEQTARSRSKSPKKQKYVVIEEKVTKTIAPLTIEEEEFTITIDPTKKGSPKKTRETFTLNIDESAEQIEKEILEKSPILPEESLVKPVVDINQPIKPIRSHVYEDILEHQVQLYPDAIDIKKATNNLIQNEITFTGWADDKHNVFKPTVRTDTKEVESKITDSQKVKRKQAKLFGLFTKTSKDVDESDDDSSRKEVVEKQDRETSKEEITTEETKSPKFKKSKSKDKDEKKFLGIFKIKPETKPFSDMVIKDMIDSTAFLKEEVDKYHDVKPVISNTEISKPEEILLKSTTTTTIIEPFSLSTDVIRDMNDCEIFLKDEIHRYHDVRPIISQQVVDLPPPVPARVKKQIKSPVSTDTLLQDETDRYYDVSPTVQKINGAVNETEKIPEKVIYLPKETKLVQEKVSSPIEKVSPKKEKKKTDKDGGLFGIFKKKGSVEVKSPEKKIVLSDNTIKDMAKSDSFLKDEIDKYHDVRPVISKTTSELVQTVKADQNKETSSKQATLPKKIKTDNESERLIGILKKKPSEEREIKVVTIDSEIKPVITEETSKHMTDSNNFLKDEVDYYHDVRQVVSQLPAEIKVIEKVEKLEVQESPKQKETSPKKTKAKEDKETGGLFGIFKKKVEAKPVLSETTLNHMAQSDSFLIDEIDRYHDVRPIIKPLLPVQIQIVEQVGIKEAVEYKREPSPQKSKAKDDKNSESLFGIFKKKPSEEPEIKVVTIVSETKPVVSTETLKNMTESNDFLKDEVDYYHDVRPVVSQLPSESKVIEKVVEKLEVQESPKQKETSPKKTKAKGDKETGGLFGIFKKKDKEVKVEEKPVLSQTTLKHMAQSDSFLKDEVDRYHDVYPIIKPTLPVQPQMAEQVKIEQTVEHKKEQSPKKSKAKDSKESEGLFGLFKKKPSEEREITVINTKPVLSETTLELITQSDTFLKDEVDKYHDVRPVQVVKEDNKNAPTSVLLEQKLQAAVVEIQEAPKKTKKEKGGILGIFASKPSTDKEEITRDTTVASDEVKKHMETTDYFLKDEIDKYHDVKPIKVSKEITTISDIPTEKLATDKIVIPGARPIIHETITITVKETIKDIQKPKIPATEKVLTQMKDIADEAQTVESEIKHLSEQIESKKHEIKTQNKEVLESYHKKEESIKTTSFDVDESALNVIDIKEPEAKKEVHEVITKVTKSAKKVTGIEEPKIKEEVHEVFTKLVKVDHPDMSGKYDSNSFIGTEIEKYQDVRPEQQQKPEIKTEEVAKKQKKDGVLFGIFKRKQQEDNTVKQPLSEIVQKHMEESDNFLIDEIEKYHDVRPIVKTEVQKTQTIDHPIGYTEVQTTQTLEKISGSPKKGKKKEADGQKGGIFGIFKKREASAERESKLKSGEIEDKLPTSEVTVTVQRPSLSEITIKEMNDSTSFLQTEIDMYHDVRQFGSNVEVTTVIEKSPKDIKDKEEGKGGLFGIFKKKTGSLERGTKGITTEHTETKKKVREPIFGKPKKIEVTTSKPILSEECIKNMIESSSFLDTEVSKYHDVKPIDISLLEKEVPKIIPTTEQTLYKTEIIEESSTTQQPLFKTVITEQSTTQESTPKEKVVKKTREKDRDGEKGGLFGIFKKKGGSLERDIKPITANEAEALAKPALSESTLQNMSQSTNFLDTEIEKYHDVRPVIQVTKEEITTGPANVKTEEPLRTQAITKEESSVSEVSKDKKKKKDKESEKGGLFGIFKKKGGSLERDAKPITAAKAQALVLSESTVRNMQESNIFLDTEIKKYHDVRPIIVTSTQEILTGPVTFTVKPAESLVKTEKITKQENIKQTKEKDIDGEKGGLFGIFKKKEGSLERDIKPITAVEAKALAQPILSESTLQDMSHSTKFLDTEIEKYHDVRPVIQVMKEEILTRPGNVNIEEPLRTQTITMEESSVSEVSKDKKKKKDKEGEKGGLFGIFKKKGGSLERDAKPITAAKAQALVLSESTIRNMQESNTFLDTEIEKYHDVRPIIVTTQQEIITSPVTITVKPAESLVKTEIITKQENIKKKKEKDTDGEKGGLFGIFKKKEGSVERDIKPITVVEAKALAQPVLCESTLQDMSQSTKFLDTEIEKYHDVRPIIQVTKEEITTRPGDVKTEEPLRTQTVTMEESTVSEVGKDKKKKKDKEGEKGSLFGIFKKKGGSLERDGKPVTAAKAQALVLSESTVRNMQESNTFLDIEIEKYHDVRPIIVTTKQEILTSPVAVSAKPAESLVKTEILTKQENIKKNKEKDTSGEKGGLFGIFKKKGGSLERDIKPITAVEAEALAKPVLSESTLQNMSQSTKFLDIEIEKYHDVRPSIQVTKEEILTSPINVKREEPLRTQTTTMEESIVSELSKDKKKKKDKESEKGGLFGIFKKKGGSLERDAKQITAAKAQALVLSESTVKNMQESNTFLDTEIEKYHDVRPVIITTEQEMLYSPVAVTENPAELLVKTEIITKQENIIPEVSVGKKKEKDRKGEKSDLFGIFKKRGESVERDIKPIISAEIQAVSLSESAVKDMHESNKFLDTEIEKYHDVLPLIVTTREKTHTIPVNVTSKIEEPLGDTEILLTEELSKTKKKNEKDSEKGALFGIFTKKRESVERDIKLLTSAEAQSVPLSQSTVQNMHESNKFLDTEINRYHDVRPITITTKEEIFTSPSTVTIKSGEPLLKSEIIPKDEIIIPETRKGKKKNKGDEIEKGGLFGIFKKKGGSLERDIKPASAEAQALTLSELTVKDMQESTKFLDTEVEKYHDVRPITVTTKEELFTSPVIITAKTEEPVLKTEIVSIEKGIVPESSKDKKKKKDKEGEKSGLFGIFKKKGGSLERDTKPMTATEAHSFALSESTVKDMQESTKFLDTEIEKYHDVRPIKVTTKVELLTSPVSVAAKIDQPLITTEILSIEKSLVSESSKDKKKKTDEEAEKSGLFGIFKKKGRSLERDIKSIRADEVKALTLSESAVKEMHDSTKFLDTEVEKYHDVRPITVNIKEEIITGPPIGITEKSVKPLIKIATIPQEENIISDVSKDKKKKSVLFGILKKKEGSIEKDIKPVSAPEVKDLTLSESTVTDMHKSTKFLEKEVEKYHDVRPIIVTTTETILTTPDSVSFKQEKPILKTEIITKQKSFIPEVNIDKKKEKHKEGEKSGLFGIFKKGGSLERDNKPIASTEAQALTFSESTVKDMHESTKFLDNELEKYHDVRPIIVTTKEELLTSPVIITAKTEEPLIKTEIISLEKSIVPESSKDKKKKKDKEGEKGGIFGIFKKKGGSLERDTKPITAVEAHDLVLSDTTIKNMHESTKFLDTEIEKYHDVRPIFVTAKEELITSPVIITAKTEEPLLKTEIISMDESIVPESNKDKKKKKEKEGEKSGIFGIFKKKGGSLERDIKLLPSAEAQGLTLSESTMKDINESNKFLDTEVQKYHDVRPTTDNTKEEILNIPHSVTLKTEKPLFRKEVIQIEEVTTFEASKDKTMKKDQESEKGGLFGIFKKKGGSLGRDNKPLTAVEAQRLTLSEPTVKNMHDSTKFLGTEIDKYHDVRPIIYQTKEEVVPSPIIVKAEELLLKTEKSIISEPIKDIKKKKEKEVEKTGLFGIFKKKGGSLERDTKPVTATEARISALSESTVKNMHESDKFLGTEIKKYHDVRPIIEPIVSESISVITKVTTNEVSVKTDPTSKAEINDSTDFLDKEFGKYHDVRPIIPQIEPDLVLTEIATETLGKIQEPIFKTDIKVETSTLQSTTKDTSTKKQEPEGEKGLFGIFKKKGRSLERDVKVPTIDINNKQISDSANFLHTEINKYHDVKPTVQDFEFEEIPVEDTKVEKSTKDLNEKGGIFRIFKRREKSLEREIPSDRTEEKKKHREPIFGKPKLPQTKPKLSEITIRNINDSNNFLDTEIEKYHDVRPITATEVKPITVGIITEESVVKTRTITEQSMIHEYDINKDKLKNKSNETEIEKSSIFKKKDGSLEKDVKPISVEEPTLSDETKVNKHHDVKPVIDPTQIESSTHITKEKMDKKEADKFESPKKQKDKKHGLFGIFKKKSDDVELNLSDEVKQNMEQSQTFLVTEVDKFHDVRPLTSQIEVREDNKILPEPTKSLMTVKEDLTFKEGLQVAIKDSDAFLKQEIEKFHDVRPIVEEVQETGLVPIEVIKKREETRDEKPKEKGFFGFFKKEIPEKDIKLQEEKEEQKSVKSELLTSKHDSDIEAKASPSKISKPDFNGSKEHIVITEKHFVKEGGYLNEVFVKETTERKAHVVESEEGMKKMHETSNFLNTELDKYEDNNRINNEQPKLPTETLGHMIISNDFINDEVTNYHDVKPVIKREDSTSKDDKEKSKKLFGLFSKKKSHDKDAEIKQIEEEKKKTAAEKYETVKPESKDFSEGEIDRYQEGKKSKEESGTFFGLFSKKTKPQEKDKSVEKELPQKLSQEVVENMKNSSEFLTKEVDLYHDVKPHLEDAFKPVPLSPIKLPELQSRKEDTSFDKLYENLRDKSPERTVSTTVTNEVIPGGERLTKVKEEVITGTIQLGPDVLNDIETLEKEINDKLEEIRRQTGGHTDTDSFPEATQYIVTEEVDKKSETDLFGKQQHSEIPDTPLPGTISEITFDEPPFVKERKLNADILRQMQQSHSFLANEIENYDDGKTEMVTDLDEDQKVKSTGLFSIFSKKEKSVSPNVTKKKFKKSKEAKSVDEPEKIGFIEKIGRKLTGGKYDVEEVSKSAKDTVDSASGTIYSEIDDTKDAVKRDYDKSKEEASRTILETERISEEAKKATQDIIDDKNNYIKEEISTTSQEIKDKGKRSAGFFSRIGEKVHGTSEEGEKKLDKKDKKSKKIGFLSKLGGKSSKEVSFDIPEATTIVEPTVTREIETVEIPKSDSTSFVSDLLQSFDDKLEHVKDDKDNIGKDVKEFEQRTQNIKKRVSDIGTEQEEKLKQTIKRTDRELETRTENIKKGISEIKSSTEKKYQESFEKTIDEKFSETIKLSEEISKKSKDDFARATSIDELEHQRKLIEDDVNRLEKEIKQRSKEAKEELDDDVIYAQKAVRIEKSKLESMDREMRKKMEKTIEKIEVGIASRVQNVEDSAETFNREEKLSKEIEKIEDDISKQLNILKGALEDTSQQVEVDLRDKSKETHEKIKSKTNEIVTSFKETEHTLKEKVDTSIKDMEHTVNEKFDKASTTVKESEQGIKDKIDTVKDTAKKSEHSIKEKLATASTTVKGTVKESEQRIKDKIDTVKDTAKKSEHTIKEKLDTAVTSTEATTTQMQDAVKEKTKVIEEKITGEQQHLNLTEAAIEDTTAKVSKKSKGFFDKLGKKITGKKDDVKESLKEEAKKVESSVEGAAEEVSTKSKGMFGKLSRKLSGKDDDIKSKESKTKDISGQITKAEETLKKQIVETSQAVEDSMEKAIYDIGHMPTRDLQHETLQFLEIESRNEDDPKMSRAVSDYGTPLKKKLEGTRKISEANLDLSNISKDDEKFSEEATKKSTPYVTSPTLTRRTFSAKITKGGKPEVIEITYDSNIDGKVSSDKYIVTEPDDITMLKKRHIFHIESEEADDPGSSKYMRSDSSSSNVLETLTEDRIESLLSDLTKDLNDSTKPIERVLKKEEIKLEQHKKDTKAEVDIIERKLRDLDRALDSLEHVEVVETIIEERNNEKIEKKLHRVERKFERMASEVMEKDSKEGKTIQLTSPEIEVKRESEYQTLVSQLSTEDISDFQKEYSHLWDEHTFSKSSDRESKTPDSQADAQELPQGGDQIQSTSSVRETTSSSTRPEGEEGAEKEESGYESRVADQHQLSEEMKELLKELERESKQ